MRNGSSIEAVAAKIDALDLAPIKFKLNKEEGWTLEYASEVERWYKRFLLLNAKYQDQPIVATKAVDTFWHQHILDTRKYAVDCQDIYGGFLHHFPYFGLRGDEDAKNLKTAFAQTLILIEEEFGESILLSSAAADSSFNVERNALTASSCSDCTSADPAATNMNSGSLFAGLASSCSDCAGSIERPEASNLNVASSCSDCSGSIERRAEEMGLTAHLGAAVG